MAPVQYLISSNALTAVEFLPIFRIPIFGVELRKVLFVELVLIFTLQTKFIFPPHHPVLQFLARVDIET